MKYKKLLFLALLSLVCIGWIHGSSIVSRGWQRVAIGGGGLVTGGDVVQTTGVRFMRTDAGGAYIWNTSTSQWFQIICQVCIPTNVTAGAQNFGYYPPTGTSQIYQLNDPGVIEIAGAPNASTVAYVFVNGHVLVSTTVDPANPQNIAWVDTGFTPTIDTPGGTGLSYRENGHYMAVDPNNSAHVLVATETTGAQTGGIWETTNGTNPGGATWAKISSASIPNPTVAGQADLIAFDPNSGTSGGITNTVYVWTNASGIAGVYITTNAESSWALMAGSPTTAQHMIVNQATVGQGDIWVTAGSVANSAGDVWQFSSATWTKRISACCHYVAINPNDGNHIAVITPGGDLNVSTNGGVSFASKSYTVDAAHSTNSPWQGLIRSRNSLTSGSLFFDPLQNDVLIYGGGQGIWTASLPSTGFFWTAMVAGVEELIGAQIGVSQAYTPTFGARDEASCTVNALHNVSPTKCAWVSGTATLSWMSGIDTSKTNPTFMVGKISADFAGGYDWSGYSTDGFVNNYTPFNTWNGTADDNSFTNNGGLVQVAVVTTIGLTTWASGSGSIVCSLASITLRSTVQVNPLSTLHASCYPVTVDDSTHFTLQTVNFSSLVTPLAGRSYIFFAPATSMFSSWNGALTVTNVADNGSGKVLVTYANSVSNLITTGDPVCLSGVTMAGASSVNGCWIATVVTSRTLTLNSSTFAGGDTYTTGGTMTTWNLPLGDIAASTNTNIAIIASDNALPQCTTDGGANWSYVDVSAIPLPPTQTTVTNGPYTTGTTSITVASTTGIVASSTVIGIPLADGRILYEIPSGVNSGTKTLTLAIVVPPGASINNGAAIYTQTGFSLAGFFTTRTVVADSVASNTFFAVNSVAGLVKWTNCSPAFVTAVTGSWTLDYGASMQLASVPGESGHLFASAGPVGSAGSLHPATSRLYRFCNGDSNTTATPTLVSGFYEPFTVGFGAVAPGQSYPSIYVVGWYAADNVRADSVFGIWKSIDDPNHGNSGGSASCIAGGTWTKIGDWPIGWMSKGFYISGDPSVYGLVYLSTGYGWSIGYFP